MFIKISSQPLKELPSEKKQYLSLKKSELPHQDSSLFYVFNVHLRQYQSIAHILKSAKRY